MKAVTTTGRWRVPWIEALPDDWQFLSAKRLFQARTELASADEPQLAATQAYGVIEQAEYERRVGRKVTKLNKNLDKRRLVRADDFIISMRSFEGGLERAWAEGGIRSSYVVLKPTAEINVGYYQHLFKSQPYIQALRATGNFIRDGQDLNFSNFALVDLPYPPLEDQALIARYLNWHGAMTGKLIHAKRRLIALLNEQKQSIVHRAVTCGLDPAAKLKPSGVDWLGDVPEHWEVKRLKWVVRLQRGYDLPADSRIDGDFPVVSSGGMIGRHAECRAPAPGVVMGRYGSTDAVFYIEEAFWPHNTSLFVTDFQGNDPRWCFHMLRTISKADHSGKSAVPGVDRKDLYDILLSVPPPAEQQHVASVIDAECKEFDQTVAKVNGEIALIQEFRTRLIADVVIGQLDVRAMAANLPDVADTEAVDDLTNEDDLDNNAEALIDEEEAA